MRQRKDAPSRRELFATLRRLEARNAELERRIEQQAQRIGDLERELAKARKNSSTSSKPPSSDIVKPPRPNPLWGKGKRKIGGQPGHARHERPPFPADAVNESHEYTLDACPGCGGRLQPANETPRVIQQVEVLEAPIRIEEHRGRAYWCRRCQRVHYAPLPPEVEKGGLVGPRLTALLEVPMLRWQQQCDRLVRYGCGIIGAGTQARTPWSGSPWFLIIAAPWRSDEIPERWCAPTITA